MKSELKGTEYIGVSRNQRKFQTLIMLGGKKRYIGTYETVEEAARAFDKYCLIYRGLKVEQKELCNDHVCRQGQIMTTREES